jgi:hypothetical protein
MSSGAAAAAWLAPLALSCALATGCGRSGARRSPPVIPVGHYLNDGDHDRLGDADDDNLHDNDHDAATDYKRDDNGDYHDSDDAQILKAGSAATPRQRAAISTVVRRYLADGAAGQDDAACRMLVPSLARSAPEIYGRGSGPSYLRGATTCAAVLAKLFAHFRGQLERPTAVTHVRVLGRNAFAALGSPSLPASYISVARSGHNGWSIGFVFPSVMP